jgi:hypothetical protein
MRCFRVFVGTAAPAIRHGTQTEGESLFERYRMNGTNGVLVLVRPDGHMSAVEGLHECGLDNIQLLLEL